MKKLMAILMLALIPGLMAACNTMEGMGQDIQNGGQKLEDTADENK